MDRAARIPLSTAALDEDHESCASFEVDQKKWVRNVRHRSMCTLNEETCRGTGLVFVVSLGESREIRVYVFPGQSHLLLHVD